MAIENHILTIIEPSIKLDEFKFKSYGEEDGLEANTSLSYGAESEPFISINGYTFNDGDINSMTIDINGTVPTIELSITDTKGYFGVDTYPRDGDVISVRILPRQRDVYKHVKIDFDIDDIESPQQASFKKGGLGKYMFSGTMKIPGAFAEACQSFEANNSLEHLEEIAAQLKLGFATNIETADDSMKLMIAYDSLIDTIKNRVSHSYVSEDSFQTFFIDPYYYLNYINLNKILESPEDLQQVMATFDANLEDNPTSNMNDGDSNEIEAPLILTSHNKANGTNMHIVSYALKNTSGAAVKMNGYKRILQYFENDSSDKLVSFNVEPMSGTKLKDMEEPLKGRRDEERYKHEVKYKYMGRIHTDPETSNTHLNYNFSKLHNKQNIDELSKLTLEVELSSWNPSITRYSKFPVVIFNQTQQQVEADSALKDAKKEKQFETQGVSGSSDPSEKQQDDTSSIDEFLTGFYVVGGMSYKYSNKLQKITQRLTLLRREWPSRINNIR